MISVQTKLGWTINWKKWYSNNGTVKKMVIFGHFYMFSQCCEMPKYERPKTGKC